MPHEPQLPLSTRPAALPPRFDPLDPAVAADPYPRYAELRRLGPLARGGPGTWLVTRHADVVRLLGDRRLGNELPRAYHELLRGEGTASAFFRRVVFYRDPPAHTRLRRLMAPGFTPSRVAHLREEIRALVDRLLAPALEAGELEAVGQLAEPLALGTIALLLGIPADADDAMRAQATALAGGFGAGTGAQRQATDAAAAWLQDHVVELLRVRRRAPRDDLMSRLLVAERGPDALSAEEIVDNCAFLFWAGFETVVSFVGTACATLPRAPDQLARLRADPSLVPGAVEELLRYDAPIQGTVRLVREPVRIGGRRVPAGRLLVLLLGSANRDEDVFRLPDRLDVGRSPNPHVSFGGGPHRCLGSVLARMEGAVVLERLLQRCARIEPAGEAVRRSATNWMRFHARVPMALAPPR